jgi:hypothetical protein
MKSSALTYIGFETNAVWDPCPDFELSFSQVHEAAKEGELITLLEERFGDEADFSNFEPCSTKLEETEAALTSAAGRERKKTGVQNINVRQRLESDPRSLTAAVLK